MSKSSDYNSKRWLVLILVMIGVFLSTMDSGMVNVALPTIMRSFDIRLETAELVVTLYLLTITVSLVFWGTLSDRLGRGNIYLSGMTIFAVGALACYLAYGFSWLLISRMFQAVGASMMMSSGPAIIKTVFPAAHLGRSLGLVGIATASGLLTGPLVSGHLLSSYSWRAIFVVTLPVSIITVICGRFFLLEKISGLVRVERQSFDWKGSCCWVALVILGLGLLHHFNRLFTLASAPFLFSFAVLVYLFIHLEKNAVNPIVPIKLFRQKYYWIAVLTVAVSFAAMFTVLVLIPFYLEYIFRLPVVQVGRLMMAVPATLIVLSPFSGWLYDKIGARYLTTFGLFLSSIALLGMALLNAESSQFEVIAKLALLGAGQSIFLSPNSASVLSRVGDEYLGISSGILATARNLGMVVGATLAAALFSWWYDIFSDGGSLTSYTSQDGNIFLQALQATFIMTACLAFLGCIFSAGRR